MAVPTEFDVDASLVIQSRERVRIGGRVDFAFAEHEMVVLAGTHVFDVDVQSNDRQRSRLIDDRRFPGSEVPNIQRQAEQGAHTRRLSSSNHRIDPHARFGLERQAYGTIRGVVAQHPAPPTESLPQNVVRHCFR